jgi:hypothetical protein
MKLPERCPAIHSMLIRQKMEQKRTGCLAGALQLFFTLRKSLASRSEITRPKALDAATKIELPAQKLSHYGTEVEGDCCSDTHARNAFSYFASLM